MFLPYTPMEALSTLKSLKKWLYRAQKNSTAVDSKMVDTKADERLRAPTDGCSSSKTDVKNTWQSLSRKGASAEVYMAEK
jgi:hypothetical protein